MFKAIRGKTAAKPPLVSLGVALAAGLLLMNTGHFASAATITVNTTADELNVDGNCSLREAIQAANVQVHRRCE